MRYKTYNNMVKAVEMIMEKGYSKEEANEIAIDIFDNKVNRYTKSVEWFIGLLAYKKEVIEKISEHTYGTHIYMKLSINGKVYEVDCYLRNGKEYFFTTADGTEMREKVIEAFNQLY